MYIPRDTHVICSLQHVTIGQTTVSSAQLEIDRIHSNKNASHHRFDCLRLTYTYILLYSRRLCPADFNNAAGRGIFGSVEDIPPPVFVAASRCR